MNTNNPYHRGAKLYETNLRLPVIASIRRHEARVVGDLLARYVDAEARVLEVGPGTGFYTIMLARLFGEVVAVEDSAQMVEIIRGRLDAGGIGNVRVDQGDFRRMSAEGEFDIAVAIGVLDYIAEPREFVEKMSAAARRAVVVTVPQRGLPGRLFKVGGALRKTRIYCYDREQVGSWLPGWKCTVAEAGATRLTRGLTLAAAFERP